jgi:hypothetical protein
VSAGNTQNIANTAWAFATLKYRGEEFFDSVETHASKLVTTGKPQEVSNTLWACAVLQHSSPNLFSTFASHTVENPSFLTSSKPQELGITAWSYATLGHRNVALFTALDSLAGTRIVTDGSPQSISNVAWSYATLGIAGENIFLRIEINSDAIFSIGCSQDIANTAWSFATLGVQRCGAFFKNVEKHAQKLVEHGNSQQIANTVWSAATLDQPCPVLCSHLESRADEIVSGSTTQGLGNLCWGLGTLRYDAPELFAAVDERSEFLVQEGQSQEIANTAAAFAELGLAPVHLFGCLDKSLERFLNMATTQHLCNVCWSLAILDLGVRHNRILQKLWRHTVGRDVEEFSVAGLNQLVQVELYVFWSGVSLDANVNEELRLRMCDAARVDNGESEREDVMNREYSELLSGIGFNHEREVCPWVSVGEIDSVNLFSIDMACRVRKIAIEYDGRTHYLSSGRQNGKTVAKRNMLLRCGWKVINVSHLENKELELIDSNEMREEKKTFLREKLGEVGVVFDASGMVYDEEALVGEYSDLLNEIGFTHERDICLTDGKLEISVNMACLDRMIAIVYDAEGSGGEKRASSEKISLLGEGGWKVVVISRNANKLMESGEGEEVRVSKKRLLRRRLGRAGITFDAMGMVVGVNKGDEDEIEDVEGAVYLEMTNAQLREECLRRGCGRKGKWNPSKADLVRRLVEFDNAEKAVVVAVEEEKEEKEEEELRFEVPKPPETRWKDYYSLRVGQEKVTQRRKVLNFKELNSIDLLVEGKSV